MMFIELQFITVSSLDYARLPSVRYWFFYFSTVNGGLVIQLAVYLIFGSPISQDVFSRWYAWQSIFSRVFQVSKNWTVRFNREVREVLFLEDKWHRGYGQHFTEPGYVNIDNHVSISFLRDMNLSWIAFWIKSVITLLYSFFSFFISFHFNFSSFNKYIDNCMWCSKLVLFYLS